MSVSAEFFKAFETSPQSDAGFDPVYGARPLKRLVQREVVDRVANEIVAGHVMEGSKVTIDADIVDGYTCKVENPQEAANGASAEAGQTYEVPAE